MIENVITTVIVVGFSLGLTAVIYPFWKSLLAVPALVGIIGGAIVIVGSYIDMGQVDPYAPLLAIFTFIYCSFASFYGILFGRLIAARRRRKKVQQREKSGPHGGFE